jgi:hypothetical protein
MKIELDHLASRDGAEHDVDNVSLRVAVAVSCHRGFAESQDELFARPTVLAAP